MDKNKLAGEFADTYGNMGSDAWNTAYTCFMAGIEAQQAKIILKELIEMYVVNVDADGEPKAPILDIVELWQRASKIVEC